MLASNNARGSATSIAKGTQGAGRASAFSTGGVAKSKSAAGLKSTMNQQDQSATQTTFALGVGSRSTKSKQQIAFNN